MKRHSLILAVFIASGWLACKEQKEKEQQPASGITRFQWLAGKWEMKDKEGIITEEWALQGDSLLTGRSDLVKGDSIIPFETIRLFIKGSQYYYEARAAGQNNELPVAFQLTSSSDSGFVAENPQHDFPKRITYRLYGKDSIHAFVDGGTANPDRRADFYYTRKK